MVNLLTLIFNAFGCTQLKASKWHRGENTGRRGRGGCGEEHRVREGEMLRVCRYHKEKKASVYLKAIRGRGQDDVLGLRNSRHFQTQNIWMRKARVPIPVAKMKKISRGKIGDCLKHWDWSCLVSFANAPLQNALLNHREVLNFKLSEAAEELPYFNFRFLNSQNCEL